jgi:hypothetical protein
LDRELKMGALTVVMFNMPILIGEYRTSGRTLLLFVISDRPLLLTRKPRS